jgi:hypothetical protein
LNEDKEEEIKSGKYLMELADQIKKLKKEKSVATVLRRAIFPAGFLQVVFVIAIVDAHLAVIDFKNAVDKSSGRKFSY